MDNDYGRYGFCLHLKFADTLSTEEAETLLDVIVHEITISAGWICGGGSTGDLSFFIAGDECEVTSSARDKLCTWVSKLENVAVCKSTSVTPFKDLAVSDDELKYEHVYKC